LEETKAVPDLKDIKNQTQAVYTRKAAYWHQVRDRSGYETHWIDRFPKGLSKGGHILDLGCGTGDPIAGYLMAQGFRVTGIDYAPTMIELAEETYPAGNWIVADITDLPELGLFDGLISWDGFFHLSIEEQREVLAKYAKFLKPGGSLLFTVGPEESEVTGQIDDETVYHASLSPQEYEKILRGGGFSKFVFQAKDAACLGRSVLLATGLNA